ncbi:MAG: discoidin domain-containing protein [Luteolibacter sp.]
MKNKNPQIHPGVVRHLPSINQGISRSKLLRSGTRALLGAAVGLTGPALAQSLPTVTPGISQDAFRNPLKGFRMGGDSWKTSPAPATLAHFYIPWNAIENHQDDTEQKIQDYCDQRWANYSANNIKVVPRVYLDWNGESGNSFPADLKTGAYQNATDAEMWSHPELRSRVERMIGRLGRVWDNDPRVAWVQSGMIGWWGEQEQPAPQADVNADLPAGKWSTLMGNAFTAAFKNKNVLVRNREQWLNYDMGVYWDSFAHPNQPWVNSSIKTHNYNSTLTYQNSVIEGETAYDWGDFPVKFGKNPMLTFANRKAVPNGGAFTGDQDYLNYNYVLDQENNYTQKLIDVIRDLHCSALGWVSGWSLQPSETAKWSTSPEVIKSNADQMHNAFGYQFVITSFSCTPNPSPGGNLQVNFSVENRGSAPIIENWPVAVVLIDPTTRQIQWKSTLAGVNIRSWLPGSSYNHTTRSYQNPPSGGGLISRSASLPATLANGQYLVGLSILDPTSGHPGVFFATNHFFKESQTQPLCQIRVGSGALPPFAIPGTVPFDSLVNDDRRSYHMPLSRKDWVASASFSQSNAPLAIDGIASSRWSTGAIQNNTGNQWFKVDLGANKAFDRIALDTEASPGDNPRAYEVHVSTDNQAWTKVASGMDSGLLTYVSFRSQNARWVRVTQTGTTTWNWWSIHEFNVYAPNNAPQFTGASSSSGPENAFDGLPGTRWTSNDWQKPGQWLEVDMRSKKSFNKVILDAAGSPNDYPRGYTVEVSNDRVAWNEIASGTGAPVTTYGVTTIPVSPQNVRHIRIRQTGTSSTAYWSVHEFRVGP